MPRGKTQNKKVCNIKESTDYNNAPDREKQYREIMPRGKTQNKKAHIKKRLTNYSETQDKVRQ